MITDGPAPEPAAPRAISRPVPPDEVTAWATERAAARAERDWPRADALKAAIEAAGWKVEDAGRAWSLFPAVTPDVVVDGVTRYGSAASVPSVLGDPPSAPATVLVVARDDVDAFARLARSLALHAPAATQVVVVGNDPAPAWDPVLAAAAGADMGDAPGGPAVAGGADDRAPAPVVDLVRTAQPLGAAAALNVGMQRARGAVVILASTDVEVTGDAIGPLVAALADPAVAVAGAFGSSAAALPRLVPSDAGGPDVIDGAWLAFRRADFVRLGPFDEHYVHPAFLDAWWSLTLRAGDAPAAGPRRAVRLDLPLVRPDRADRRDGPPDAPDRADRGDGPPDAPDRADRLARRNGYRLLDRFGDRRDLIAAVEPAPAGSAHG